MIWAKVLGTVLLGISYMSMFLKNIALYNHTGEGKKAGWIFWTIYGIVWRTFLIVAIWCLM